ncbi:hypothetical protein Cs7R123_14920 [Catellatospora sp. TT07R-123]|uniref:DUF2975 domain-containing protein n=1 Tax=Catellatospora sp. TT07R-123 TaxID=2733863 RepID=UPI001AFF9827|nr:DUF2975 domain-containing protein [Catellatospora sp. TT07R-123]GHJ44150.1 hypothetical protein Cs7R123_14920 [Catellatospora sp. TT07R-123]
MGATVKVSARLLTVLLGVVAVFVLVFGVWPALLGPAGLDLVRGVAPMPVPQSVPQVAVQPGAQFAQRWQSAGTGAKPIFDWVDTSDGTRDATTGRLPVELMPWGDMRLSFWGMDLGDRLAYVAPELLAQALILLVLWLLWRTVRTVPAGEVFTVGNARRMVGVGLAVAAGGSAVQLVAYQAHRLVVEHSAAAGVVRAVFSFSWVPLVAGAVVLLLAEVFRQGVRLRADVDGLV